MNSIHAMHYALAAKRDELATPRAEWGHQARTVNTITEYKRIFGTQAAIALRQEHHNISELLDEMERQIKQAGSKQQDGQA